MIILKHTRKKVNYLYPSYIMQITRNSGTKNNRKTLIANPTSIKTPFCRFSTTSHVCALAGPSLLPLINLQILPIVLLSKIPSQDPTVQL